MPRLALCSVGKKAQWILGGRIQERSSENPLFKLWIEPISTSSGPIMIVKTLVIFYNSLMRTELIIVPVLGSGS